MALGAGNRAIATLTCWALMTAPAAAFDADRLELALGDSRLLTAEGSDVPPHLSLRAALAGRLDQAPLVLQTPTRQEARLVERLAVLDVALSLALFDWVEVGFGLPVAASASGRTTAGTRFNGYGVGDLRLQLKVALWRRAAEGPGLALVLPVTLSTGPLQWWLSAEGATFTPQLAFDLRWPGFRWNTTAGYRLRGVDEALYEAELGDAFVFATGPEIGLGAGVSLLGEVFGETPVDGFFDDDVRSPIEALGGVRWRAGRIELTAAGGAPIRDGAGAPEWRGLLLFGLHARRAPARLDQDGDGIEDALDRCPTVPEDRDGVVDEDGCPEVDGDGDGLRDETDGCPSAAEDPDGVADADGCPEEDADHDGVPDAVDRCPEAPGPAAAKGCPPGLADTDEDGINDVVDQCPNEPETVNQTEDEDGCPDTAMTDVRRVGRAEIVERTIAINGRIQFAGAGITEASIPLVDDVARLLLARPDLRVRIEGHTDEDGSKSANKRRSAQWAAAVFRQLVRRGVPAEQLRHVGLGEAYPIESNATPAGRAANRRVELHLE